MASTVTLEGLDQLRQQLRNLPADLTGEARSIVDRRAQNAAAAIRENYPEGPTGNLRNRVSVSVSSASQFVASATVASRAPHAVLFEFGSQIRQTHRGANRGRMPAAGTKGMIPIAIRERRAMYQDLKALVTRAGFVISGDL